MGFAPLIDRHHGASGVRVLRNVMQTLRGILQHYTLGEKGQQLVVFQFLPQSAHHIKGLPSEVIEHSDLIHWSNQSVAIEIRADGCLQVWPSIDDIDPIELSHHAIVYSLFSGEESFWAGGEQAIIPAIFPGSHSLFAIPTFEDLQSALKSYRSTVARVCQCEILSLAWCSEKRLLFRAKPEKFMRRSLVQFLRASLRKDANVQPEQNVDETHPVDIKVSFDFTPNVTLIEIKWLGKSLNQSGDAIGTIYSEVRARDGVQQLADYLDMFHQSDPLRKTRGYLVVIDGRRRGLTIHSTSIARVDGMHYDHREIAFDPSFHETRGDFETPIRMFVEPIYQ